MIVALNGYGKTGKDTVAKLFQRMMEQKWENKKFAYKLKQVAGIMLGCDPALFEDQEFKDTILPECWWYGAMGPTLEDKPYVVEMTVREFLQRLGTDAVRFGLHQNAWVNALFADYKIYKGYFSDIANGREDGDGYPNWIITDCRFPNEASAVKAAGGLVVRVNRPGVGPVNAHESETALDEYLGFDYVINNDGDLKTLETHVSNFISFKINNNYE